jgi:glutaredoxin
MVMPDHLCPYGLKSKDLLERQGFTVEDHHLKTRDETEAFKKEHGVDTTPQTFIGGERIGGYDDLREHFGQEVKDEDETSYQPVIAIFSVAFLMALAVSWYTFGTVLSVRAFEWFIAISMCILAIQKLQDVESFSTMFLNYDLLARRWVRYGYLYPFGEALAGHPDDRRRADLDRGPRRAVHRHGRRGLGLQGRLHRQARSSNAPASADRATCRWASSP